MYNSSLCLVEPHFEFSLGKICYFLISLPVRKRQHKINCAIALRIGLNF